jgi:hypothetical protein
MKRVRGPDPYSPYGKLNGGAVDLGPRMLSVFREAVRTAQACDRLGEHAGADVQEVRRRAAEVARDLVRLTDCLEQMTSTHAGSKIEGAGQGEDQRRPRQWQRWYANPVDLVAYRDGTNLESVPPDVRQFIERDRDHKALGRAGETSILRRAGGAYASSARVVEKDGFASDFTFLRQAAAEVMGFRKGFKALREERERLESDADVDDSAVVAERLSHAEVDRRPSMEGRLRGRPGALDRWLYRGPTRLRELEAKRLEFFAEVLGFAESQFYVDVADHVKEVPRLSEALGGVRRAPTLTQTLELGRVVSNVAAHPDAADHLRDVTAEVVPSPLLGALQRVVADRDLLPHRPKVDTEPDVDHPPAPDVREPGRRNGNDGLSL